jgi:ubiquinone/menaquinone biosynthesis C-methylase UbiE
MTFADAPSVVLMPEMTRFEKSLVNRRGDRFFLRLLDRIDHDGGLVLPPGAAVLELGAGNGTLSALLYERYHPAKVYATDFDPEQLQVARQNLGRKWGALPEGFAVERADAAHLAFPNATFDLVVAHLMLHHVGSESEERQALREITRVLKPGARFLYVEMIRKWLVREELTRLGYRVLFHRRSFRFFGFSDAVVAASPSPSDAARPSPGALGHAS